MAAKGFNLVWVTWCAFQGEFVIDLTGTGLKLSPDAEWLTTARMTSLDVNYSSDRQRVEGTCVTQSGCGSCRPKQSSVIPVDVILQRWIVRRHAICWRHRTAVNRAPTRHLLTSSYSGDDCSDMPSVDVIVQRWSLRRHDVCSSTPVTPSIVADRVNVKRGYDAVNFVTTSSNCSERLRLVATGCERTVTSQATVGNDCGWSLLAVNAQWLVKSVANHHGLTVHEP